METVTITELRAKCYAILRRVEETGQPVVVTRQGKALGQIVPAPWEAPKASTFGCMRGTAEILGDIVGPLGEVDWEVDR